MGDAVSDRSKFRRIQRELQMARDADADPEYLAGLQRELDELYETGE